MPGEAKSPASACSCGRIDVHAHYLPEPYRRALERAGLARLDGGMPVPPWSIASHLEMMERHRIETSILSISSPGLQFLDSGASQLARECNEAGAELVRAHPGRFGLFATLPLPNVAAALVEIDYAFDHLGVDGIVLETNFKGSYLGDPLFTPVFDALEERKAVIFIHPTSPECLAQVGMGLPGPVIEFTFDTVRAVVSLLYANVLVDRPNIRVILSHGGGALPSLASRVARISQAPFLPQRPAGGEAAMMAEMRRFYYDLALSATPLNFEALRRLTDVSHILFGSDFPFAGPAGVDANTAAFDELMTSISRNQRAMVERENALSLFGRLTKEKVGSFR